MSRLVALIAIAAGACHGSEPEGPPKVDGPATAADKCELAKVRADDGVMAWIADDYPAAIACAKARKVPVVIDEWAPWCHTCLSMQSTVFTDPSFKADGPRFVFASLDTDRPQNAAAVAKLPPAAWPTFYVVGPDEAVLARFVGSSSVAQFHAFLDSGARAMAGGVAGADAHLLGAERALVASDGKLADEELTAALAAAPKDWARRPDALGSLLAAKYKRGDFTGCLDVAEHSLDETGNAAPAADFVVYAMACAKERETQEADQVAALRARAVVHLQALLADPAAQLSVDDRTDAMANLRELLDTLGKHDEAKAVAEQELALLDATAAKAPTPVAAMTYNWPRCEVYNYLGRPLDLVPALERSAADLPGEYDPAARIGWLYLQAGKLDEAARWIDTALRLVYGPRKARLLGTRADIAAKQADHVAERQFRGAVVKAWETMPAGQAQPEALAKARAALVAIDK
jgi:thioredoxin-like negative regulator of GroEL